MAKVGTFMEETRTTNERRASREATVRPIEVRQETSGNIFEPRGGRPVGGGRRKRPKETHIQIRVHAGLRAQFQQLTKDQGISMTDVLIRAIKDYVDEYGSHGRI